MTLEARIATLEARHARLEARYAETYTLLFGETKRGRDGKLYRDPSCILDSALHRIEALEQRAQLRYTGVWQAGASYSEGELVTHQGSIWACLAPTSARPGTTPLEWQLAVKRGRDARARAEKVS